MFFNLSVAEVTRKPSPAALELHRNNVAGMMIMSTARFWIDLEATDFDAMNYSCHTGTRSRGHTKTSKEAITKQPIMMANPPVNEPVR